MRSWNLACGFLAMTLFCIDGISWGQSRMSGEEATAPLPPRAKTIYLEVDASTWKPRGRFLYDVEGSIRVKLTSMGFRAVRSQEEPHDLILQVSYREEPGEQYGVDLFGTVITGVFRLVHRTMGPLLVITVRETSHPTISGTPPYLDALQNFQTNPYYYFLGDILWGWVQEDLNTVGGLIRAIQKMVVQAKQEHTSQSLERFKKPDHYMVPSQELYAPIAIQYTTNEFVRIKDLRVLPALVDLLDYPDVRVRLGAVEVLGALRAMESRQFLEYVAVHDKDDEVRHMANAVIQSLRTDEAAVGP